MSTAEQHPVGEPLSSELLAQVVSGPGRAQLQVPPHVHDAAYPGGPTANPYNYVGGVYMGAGYGAANYDPAADIPLPSDL